jgi:hypothetical protein
MSPGKSKITSNIRVLTLNYTVFDSYKSYYAFYAPFPGFVTRILVPSCCMSACLR